MKKKQNIASNVLKNVVLGVMACVYAFPLVWLVLTSLKDNTQIFSLPATLWPSPIKWQNYINAFNTIPIALYMSNTVIVAVCASAGAVFVASFVGYGFSKINWKYRDQAFVAVIATQMIPFQVVMIPIFVMFTKMGITDTLLPLILPRWFGAFYIFLCRQHMMSIPNDLIEAAKLDGCSHLGIYARIVLPLSKSTLFAIALFEVQDRWNNYIEPLIFIRDENLKTLSLGLTAFVGLYETQWDLMMAACVMFIFPIILVFIIFQKQFMAGIATTGLK